MRVFWIAITVLVLAAAGAWMLRGRGGSDAVPPDVSVPARATDPRVASMPAPAPPAAHDGATQRSAADSTPAGAPSRPASMAPTPAPVPQPQPTPSAAANPVPESQAAPSVPAVTPSAPPSTTPAPAPASAAPANAAASAPATPAPTAAPTQTASPAPEPAKSVDSLPKTELVTPTTPVPETKPAAEAVKPEAPKVEAPKPAAAEATKATGAAETKPTAKTDEKTAAAKQEPPNPKMELQEDGSFLVDDKYVLKGKGTKGDPYRITWEQLVSAQDSYQPRLGKKQIPDRVRMLDGKWIRISGYIAFPLMAQSQDEMLMMLNQWDGCCIGVPPTPYDAIEVKLKAAAKGEQRMRTTGTLTGVLRVDPYLVKDWLVSLYVMDDGELSDAAGQANPGQHAK